MAQNTGVIPGYNYVNITSTGTTVVQTGQGVLHTITFNNPLATAVVTLYDNTAASGSVLIGTITIPATPMPVTLTYDATFTAGLTVKLGTANSDITVTYI